MKRQAQEGESMKIEDTKRVLLISSSRVYRTGYLDHAEDEIRDFLGNVDRVLFVPFALNDCDAYASMARERFGMMGYKLESLHTFPDKQKAVKQAEAMFVGGGNTFRLLKTLYDLGLMHTIKRMALEGMPYMGSSAGSNIAGPTIRTTNDMPIVEPPSFKALGLVPFQLNPHYLDADPHSTHMGETREERILQFFEENETPVVGLREGAIIRFEWGSAILKGVAGARIFRKWHDPIETEPGANLDQLLSLAA
jgi:dipeptidase E